MYGEDVVIEGSEILARCIQHETDHLDCQIFEHVIQRYTSSSLQTRGTPDTA
jgi:peptide deformylase